MNANIATLLEMSIPFISLTFDGDEFYGDCKVNEKTDGTHIVTITPHEMCRKSYGMVKHAFFDCADFDSGLMRDVEIHEK